jgi:hypothetical protein
MFAEISRCLGGDATPSTTKNAFERHIKHNAKLIHEALRNGDDPMSIDSSLITLGGGHKKIKDAHG